MKTSLDKLNHMFHQEIHLIVLATALIISAGYIINSFYDLEKDLINRPEQTIFGRLVSKSFCLYCYLTFNVIALALALFVSLNVFIFFALFAAALWSYSHKFQRYAILRELSASLLSVASVLVIALYFNFLSEDLAIYAVLMMLILFNKEIIREQDRKGFNRHRSKGSTLPSDFRDKT